MAAPFLPVSPAPLILEVITALADVIVLKARTVGESVACPACGHQAQRVHSRYHRRLLDLPWQGQCVRIELTVRKLFCDNDGCARRIFTEPLPGIAARYARKTCRLADALLELVLLGGGEAAARIARTFGLLVSPDALLQVAHRAPAQAFPTPRVLGVDDFAFRRGQTYGTILIDQERRHPVELLPDRETSTLAGWLKEHPGVQIVTRDRALGYAEGIRQGAPKALQVSDRWHLLKNLGDTLERLAPRFHAPIRAASRSLDKPGEAAELPESASPTTCTRAAQEKACRRERRLERFGQIKELEQQGLSLREIARRTGHSRNTVRKQTRSDTFPERAPRAKRPGKIAPFIAYVKQRWQEGEHNATRLHQEIQKQGFSGQVALAQRHVQSWRVKPRRRVVTEPRPRPPSPRQIACLLGRPENQLKERDRALLTALTEACPDLARARERALEFGRLLRERNVGALAPWRETTKSCELAELIGFAKSLELDLSAVEAALSTEWSNGPTEGQVNRLKFVKRSMYGRGSFALLRARILHRPAA